MKRVVLILCCGALPLTLLAQSPVDTAHDRSGMRATEVWAGYSRSSPKWGVLGNRPGLSFAIAAVRMTNRVKTTPRYALDYTLDIVPIALSSPPLGSDQGGDTGGNFSSFGGSDPNGCIIDVFGCRFPNGSAYGAGISPLGISVIYRRDKLIQPRLGAVGGILFFDRSVPTVISTRFNFTAMIEVGAEILNRRGNGLLLMYRFHHLSNAGTGYDNSALASHVLSLGARFRTPGR